MARTHQKDSRTILQQMPHTTRMLRPRHTNRKHGHLGRIQLQLLRQQRIRLSQTHTRKTQTANNRKEKTAMKKQPLVKLLMPQPQRLPLTPAPDSRHAFVRKLAAEELQQEHLHLMTPNNKTWCRVIVAKGYELGDIVLIPTDKLDVVLTNYDWYATTADSILGKWRGWTEEEKQQLA